MITGLAAAIAEGDIAVAENHLELSRSSDASPLARIRAVFGPGAQHVVLDGSAVRERERPRVGAESHRGREMFGGRRRRLAPGDGRHTGHRRRDSGSHAVHRGPLCRRSIQLRMTPTPGRADHTYTARHRRECSARSSVPDPITSGCESLRERS